MLCDEAAAIQAQTLREITNHQNFMVSISALRNAIFSNWENASPTKINDELADINNYGDEPVFSFLLFDKLLEELN